MPSWKGYYTQNGVNHNMNFEAFFLNAGPHAKFTAKGSD
jgi:hypothetical protein